MTTVLFAEPKMDLDHRADVLRGIATVWDPTIFAFDRTHPADCPLEPAYGSGYCVNLIVDGLTRQAAMFTALPYQEVLSYMEELRDATNALARFETGEGWDGDEDDEKRYYTDETVLGMLNDDIDFALWPLLSGMSAANVCFDCKRSGKRVSRWGVREPLRVNCADCEARR